MAKNKLSTFGDGYDEPLYSDELDVLAEENKQQQIQSYKNLDIDKQVSAIQGEATNFIKNIVKLYHRAEKKTDDLYFDDEERESVNAELDQAIESVSAIESVNLVMLLKQVKFGDHLVETLMRRLESGGNMDHDLIDKIMSAQQNALNLTLTISSYIRNLPTFFKNLKNDLSEGNVDMDKMIQLDDSSGILKLEEVNPQSLNEPTEFDISKPQKGMKELLKNAQRARAELNKDRDGEVIDFEEVQ